jgi:hypothetical protein
MKAACPRLFEVEALRDGRLNGAERARFEVHLASCNACAREARALQSLAEALRAASPTEGADELHLRRERTRLLAAFGENPVPAPVRDRARPWLGAAAFAVVSAMATLAIILWLTRGPPAPAPIAQAPAPATVRADSSASWSRRVENHLETITLERGALAIRVDHTTSQRRLLVILPDGELEDIGTTFSVSADNGHTTRVSVQDGTVVLRLRGSPAIVLAAGESWTPTVKSAAEPLPSAAAPPPPRKPNPTSASPAPSAQASSSALAIAPSSPADPGADFRQAMSALSSGDNARAATLFADFLAKHPRDARAEDSAYLRVLALHRTGNRAATEQAAQSYLSRYPRGFRHAEVETLARSAR